MVSKTQTTGQFDQSFMFHMIRDFFLLAMVVAAVELGIRYAALRYDFSVQEPARVDRAAQQLASDVKSIMLNSGGPLAAQTVYPILNRNYDDLALSIAVVPAPVTVESMKVSFQMDVRGLQARWPAGQHQEASTTLSAEQFCLNCHVKAKVGDVLGTVIVRSYLDRKEAAWWKEVRLTAGALSLKILVHTVVLFLLLRVRMAPLLTLRSTVSSLAKGVMDLRPRAQVNTADEFGELAQDLNHFLDRIGVVVHDLDKILSEVVTVGTRLGALNRGLEQQVDDLRDASVRGLSDGAQRSLDNQLMAAREAGSFDALEKTLAQTLAALDQAGAVPHAAVPALRAQLADLRQSFLSVSSAVKNMAPPIAITQAHSAEYQSFTQSLREMALLEATMQKVAESGQQVLQRLSQERQRPQAA
jgi:methyl-accepting chemotaxis protein